MLNKPHDTAISPRAHHFQSSSNYTKYWLDECPIKTYYANSLAILIPEGEKFFIKSVRAFLPDVHCPYLKQQLKSFIQQEANHSREFQKFLQHHIYHYYPELKLKITSFPIFGLLALLGGRKMRLSLTVIAEHFTAVIADIQLKHPDSFQGIAPDIAILWQWHCIEEIEHKAVAFDVLSYCGYSYFLRLITFLFVAPFIIWTFIRFFCRMMKKDKNHRQWQFYKANFTFIKKNASLLWQGFKHFSAFIKPSFHPWQHDNKDLIEKWGKKLLSS